MVMCVRVKLHIYTSTTYLLILLKTTSWTSLQDGASVLSDFVGLSTVQRLLSAKGMSLGSLKVFLTNSSTSSFELVRVPDFAFLRNDLVKRYGSFINWAR